MLLDENLSWKYHINELSKKLSGTIVIFNYRIRHFVPFEILKLLYYSLFHSFLSYGIAVWGFTYKSYFQKLFVLQNKIIKVMTFNRQTAHSTLIFTNIQLLKVTGIRPMALCLTQVHLKASEHEMLSFSVRKEIIKNDNSLAVILLSKVVENEFLQTL